MAHRSADGGSATAALRLAVVTTEIGIRSEVWMMRQLQAFTRFRSTLIGWTRAPDSVPLPDGVESALFNRGDPRKMTTGRRIRRRLGLASGYLPDAATRIEVRNRIEQCRPDAVLCHFGWNGIVVGASLPPGIPLLVHVHGRDVSLMLRQPGYRAALAAIMPRVQHLVAVGQFQIDRLAALFPLPPHSVIPCGAPTGLFASRPLSQRNPGDPIRFISVGRISEEKGVLQSLAAFESVYARHPASTLSLVGQGPLEAELDAAIARSPARAAIERLGYRAPDQLADALAGSHVLIQHSRAINGWNEGLPVTLTEGGAAGLPLVVSRNGGIPEQVRDTENGYLFDSEDVPTQAAAMLRLAEDEALRRRMGETAREVAMAYDSLLLSRRLEDVLVGLTTDASAKAR
jgi:glycosyltransferase involved in cell wall biosynthesis